MENGGPGARGGGALAQPQRGTGEGGPTAARGGEGEDRAEPRAGALQAPHWHGGGVCTSPHCRAPSRDAGSTEGLCPPEPPAPSRTCAERGAPGSLLLARGELADLAAGRAGLARGVGGGAGPTLRLGFGAQLPRLRPVHADGLGQPPAAALPVLPRLLLRHLSCKGTQREAVAAPAPLERLCSPTLGTEKETEGKG